MENWLATMQDYLKKIKDYIRLTLPYEMKIQVKETLLIIQAKIQISH